MKKSKLFILLPLVALTLSGCNTTTVSEPPTTSSSESSSEESKTTDEGGYSSYTLSFTFLYQGDLQSAPDGSSIYYAGDTNGWSFTPLKEDEGSYKLELGAIEYGTYSYKLFIEYDDGNVGWEKEVYPKNADNSDATFTVSETDGGSQSIECTLDSYTLEDILGSKSEGGDTEDQGGGNTGDDDEGQGQGGDTGGTGGGTGDDDDDDEDEDEDAEIIAAIISSLSNITYLDQEWDAVHVTDIDEDGVTTDYYVTSDENSYLYGKYESGDAYGYYTEQMLYEYDGEEYSSRNYNNQYDDFVGAYSDPLDVIDELEDEYSEYADLSTDSEGNYVLTYDLTEEDDAVYTFTATSSYDIIEMGYVDDYYGDNYIVAKYTVAEVEVKMQGFNIDDWTPAVTEVYNYTLSFAFTTSEGGEALTLPANTSLYITYGEATEAFGDFKELTAGSDSTYTYTFDVLNVDYYAYNIYIGYTEDSWHTADTCYQVVGDSWFTVYGTEEAGHVEEIEHIVEADFSEIIPTTYTFNFAIYYESTLQSAPEGYSVYASGDFNGWSGFSELTPEADGTYSLTITGIRQSGYSVQLVLGKSGSTGSYETRITADLSDIYCAIEYKTTTNSSPIIVTASSALEDIIAEASEEGDGTKPGATYVNSYTLVITLYDSDGHMKQCPSGGSLYMASGLNGSWNTAYDGYWDWGDQVKLEEATTDDGVTYSYTYESAVVNETYSYNLYYVESGATFDWNNGKLGDTDFSFTVDSGATDSYTQSITCTGTSDVISSFTDVYGHDVEGYTLVFTIYDTNSQVQKCPDWGFLSLQGDFTTTAGGTWDSAYYDMTEIEDQSGNVAYSVHFNSISAGTHSFNIMFTYTGDTVGWTPIRTANGNFSCTTADGLQPGTYYFTATGSDNIESTFPSHEGAATYNVYLCIVDTSGSTSVNNISVACDDGIFVNNGYEDYTWDNVTRTTTTYNGVESFAAYQASSLVMYAGASHWANFKDDNGSNYYFEFTVPDDLGEDICFIVFADCSKFDTWTDNPSNWYESATGTWYAGTPETVFASGFTTV